MKFTFNGQELNTCKPIYVMGYTIVSNWFVYCLSEKSLSEKKSACNYKLACRKCRIKELHIDKKGDVIKILASPEIYTYTAAILKPNDCFVSTSAKKTIRLFKDKADL